jgi:hypothetical protein
MLEFNEPDESEWPSIASALRARWGIAIKTAKEVFKRLRDGDLNAQKQRGGAGRPRKLKRDNAGLIAAAAALNNGTPPKLAVDICNTVNEKKYPAEYHGKNMKISRNTLLATLEAYTDFRQEAIPRRKTGRKDTESDWAKARVVVSEQMQDQVSNGKKVDSGKITLQEANSCECPPIFKDGVLHLDENHSQAKIGGSGHGGSSAGTQYRIAVDPKTGELKPMSDGGVMPQRKERVQAKYTKEARGCYGVACPTINGQLEPQFMETWDYTETKLVSFKVYKKEQLAEMKYCQEMQTMGWKDYAFCNPLSKHSLNLCLCCCIQGTFAT